VAVNFLLTDARDVSVGGPLGRTWVGWKATATDDQLWEVNRGLWTVGDRVETERVATLSFEGHIEVVAEITGRTRYNADSGPKWALSGVVLRAGDPVHDELKGSPAPRHRNPVSYFDTSRLESTAWRSTRSSPAPPEAVPDGRKCKHYLSWTSAAPRGNSLVPAKIIHVSSRPPVNDRALPRVARARYVRLPGVVVSRGAAYGRDDG
jgi:hypothetical protein